jgi:hypothetical protein
LVGWLIYPNLTEKSSAPARIRMPDRPAHNLGTKPAKKQIQVLVICIFAILIFIFRQKFLVARNSLRQTRITDRVKHKPCLQTRNETSDVCAEERAGLNPLTCVLTL